MGVVGNMPYIAFHMGAIYGISCKYTSWRMVTPPHLEHDYLSLVIREVLAHRRVRFA